MRTTRRAITQTEQRGVILGRTPPRVAGARRGAASVVRFLGPLRSATSQPFLPHSFGIAQTESHCKA